MINLETASTATLVTFYNTYAAKPVTRFSDRKTAVRRVAKLLDELKAAELDKETVSYYGVTECPHCGVHLSNGVHTHNHEVNGKPVPNDTHEHHCLACGGEFGREIRKARKNPNLGNSIAASWNDPEVRAARSARHHVEVTDQQGGVHVYRSVKQAFDALGLPLGQHIKFRGELKAAGELTFNGFKFKAIEV